MYKSETKIVKSEVFEYSRYPHKKLEERKMDESLSIFSIMDGALDNLQTIFELNIRYFL